MRNVFFIFSVMLLSACSSNSPRSNNERIITDRNFQHDYFSNERYHRFGFNRFAYRNPRTYSSRD